MWCFFVVAPLAGGVNRVAPLGSSRPRLPDSRRRPQACSAPCGRRRHRQVGGEQSSQQPGPLSLARAGHGPEADLFEELRSDRRVVPAPAAGDDSSEGHHAVAVMQGARPNYNLHTFERGEPGCGVFSARGPRARSIARTPHPGTQLDTRRHMQAPTAPYAGLRRRRGHQPMPRLQGEGGKT